jgi:hypothetical protein
MGMVLSVYIHIPRNTPADIILMFTGGGALGCKGSFAVSKESKIAIGLLLS